MLRTVRKVVDAENRSVFLNLELNESAKSTEKAPLKFIFFFNFVSNETNASNPKQLIIKFDFKAPFQSTLRIH